MKRTLITAILLALALPAARAAACPYDLLAMCKVGRNHWRNCCEVWKEKQPSSSSSDSGGGLTAAPPIAAVAAAPCVRKCNAESTSTARREACYATCAEAPAAGSTTPAAAVGGPGSIGIGTPSGYFPTLAQTGGTTAKVPMKHGSCGLDCGIHVLANPNGNLDMPFKIGMTCPPGTTVVHLQAKPAGKNAVAVVTQSTGSAAFSKSITLQPWSASDFEKTCQQAMGGSWPLPDQHKKLPPEISQGLQTSVEVWGKCSGWANEEKRSYPAALTLTCIDTHAYPTPVP